MRALWHAVLGGAGGWVVGFALFILLGAMGA